MSDFVELDLIDADFKIRGGFVVPRERARDLIECLKSEGQAYRVRGAPFDTEGPAP